MTAAQLLEWMLWPGLIAVTVSGGAVMYARWLNAKAPPLRQAETTPSFVGSGLKAVEEESKRKYIAPRRRWRSKPPLSKEIVTMVAPGSVSTITSVEQRALDYSSIVGRPAAQDKFFEVGVQLKHPLATVSQVQLAVGAETPEHAHEHDYVVIPRAVTTVLKTTFKDGQKQSEEIIEHQPGQPYVVLASEEGVTFSLKNIGSGPMLCDKAFIKPK